MTGPAAPPLPAELDALVRRMRLPYLRKAAPEVTARVKAELGASALEVHVSGTATLAAKAALTADGWTLKERAVAGLSIVP